MEPLWRKTCRLSGPPFLFEKPSHNGFHREDHTPSDSSMAGTLIRTLVYFSAGHSACLLILLPTTMVKEFGPDPSLCPKTKMWEWSVEQNSEVELTLQI